MSTKIIPWFGKYKYRRRITTILDLGHPGKAIKNYPLLICNILNRPWVFVDIKGKRLKAIKSQWESKKYMVTIPRLIDGEEYVFYVYYNESQEEKCPQK